MTTLPEIANQDDTTRNDQVLYWWFAVARCLLLGLAAIVTAIAWASYRRPGIALAVLVVGFVESAALFWRTGRHRVLAPALLIWADTGLAAIGLVVLAWATIPVDRTAWVNWMEPLSYSVVCAAAIGLRLRQAISAMLLLVGVYLATVIPTASTGSLAATAVANAGSIAGWFTATLVVVASLRRAAQRVDEAHHQALAEGQRLAAERERTRQHRLLHDSALQTLEAVARGWARSDDIQLRHRAAEEAARLRAGIAEPTALGEGLRAALDVLAREFAGGGLCVEVVADQLVEEPKPEVEAALRHAVAETLTNVDKHAGVDRAVVWAASAPGGGIELIIRDQGRGFDPASCPAGFGRSQSIEARMAEVGGTATVTACPGEGTRVRLWAPS